MLIRISQTVRESLFVRSLVVKRQCPIIFKNAFYLQNMTQKTIIDI